jgi:hypothetical protein
MGASIWILLALSAVRPRDFATRMDKVTCAAMSPSEAPEQRASLMGGTPWMSVTRQQRATGH